MVGKRLLRCTSNDEIPLIREPFRTESTPVLLGQLESDRLSELP